MQGFTPDEAFLNQLATHTFLRFWSWPNLFRDQGESTRGGDGKEICDLVVIFGEDILIFSDKRIRYSSDKGESIAWTRWARKAIGDSLKQLEGAERWLRSFPQRIYLDKKCSTHIPISMPDMQSARFHRIIVCHGLDEELERFNGEASFVFDGSIRGSKNWDNQEARPFNVGNPSLKDNVHIFTQTTIELILNEFDTIKDFLWYLIFREKLLNWNPPLRIRSEGDIVQLYYESWSDTDERSPSITESMQQITIDKGGFKLLQENQSLKSRKSANTVSYFWDNLIERFSYHVLTGTSEAKQSWELPHEIEPSLRLLAEGSRFERRVISKTFIEFYDLSQPKQRGTRIFTNPNDDSIAYLILLLPHQPFPDLKTYRETRRKMLEDYCSMAKLTAPRIKRIIGIAAKTRENTAPIDATFFDDGQDFLTIDLSDWDETSQKHANQLQATYRNKGLLGSRVRYEGMMYEFPNQNGSLSVMRKQQPLKGYDRNSPCSCGSGLKSKRCCGRQF